MHPRCVSGGQLAQTAADDTAGPSVNLRGGLIERTGEPRTQNIRQDERLHLPTPVYALSAEHSWWECSVCSCSKVAILSVQIAVLGLDDLATALKIGKHSCETPADYFVAHRATMESMASACQSC